VRKSFLLINLNPASSKRGRLETVPDHGVSMSASTHLRKDLGALMTRSVRYLTSK
jgi:hypothetical protein